MTLQARETATPTPLGDCACTEHFYLKSNLYKIPQELQQELSTASIPMADRYFRGLFDRDGRLRVVEVYSAHKLFSRWTYSYANGRLSESRAWINGDDKISVVVYKPEGKIGEIASTRIESNKE